jgi:prepilin-type N-terminal cleavage/methylation domain-containing protein
MEYLKKSQGFTLIEILIALIILSISLLALASLMVVATKNNSFGAHMTEAVTFAQDKLEEFRAIRWETSLPFQRVRSNNRWYGDRLHPYMDDCSKRKSEDDYDYYQLERSC